jgi:predicted ATPase
LQQFKIAEKIKFVKDKDYDTFKVKLLKNGKWMMLSDEGFGVSQVLPVILSCCPIIDWNYEFDEPFQYNEPKLVLIEEPETNLHPALQSKLADMFMDAIKTFNIRFVIETHSEYLVRKLQYLTGKGDIKPEDTVIYYFYPPTEVPEGEPQVKKINIREDGMLTKDFGKGFFDESALWAFELLKLQNMN